MLPFLIFEQSFHRGRLRYIPLPRIELSDEDYDIAFDNVVLSTENILPNLVEFAVQKEVQLSPRPELPDAYFMNVINLNIFQIQADIRNVEFAYRKKSFPKMEVHCISHFFCFETIGYGTCRCVLGWQRAIHPNENCVRPELVVHNFDPVRKTEFICYLCQIGWKSMYRLIRCV
jgi:hypothetical protein